MRHQPHRARQRLRSDGTVAFAESLREQPRPLPELCRRHVPVAWRTAMAITSDPAGASDAVAQAFGEVLASAGQDAGVASSLLRPQLLAATRDIAVSTLRSAGPVQRGPRDRSPAADTTLGPDEGLATRVAEAFRSLPERWRSVLWLVEVERIPAPEAARIIGVAPREIAGLTSTAWAGLRELSLAETRPGRASSPRACLAVNPGVSACRPTADRLAGYFSGALGANQRAEVDAHLAGCDACAAHLAQLQDLATALRQVVVPLPEGLLAAATADWEPDEPTGRRIGSGFPTEVGKPLVRAWLAALGLAIIGVAVLDQASAPLVPPTATSASAPTQTSPTVVVVQVARSVTSHTGPNPGVPAGPASAPTPASSDHSSNATGSSGQGTGSTDPTTGHTASPTPAAGSTALVLPTSVLPSAPPPIVTQPTGSALPQVALNTGVGGIPVALNLGPCTGLQLSFLSVGCTSSNG